MIPFPWPQQLGYFGPRAWTASNSGPSLCLELGTPRWAIARPQWEYKAMSSLWIMCCSWTSRWLFSGKEFGWDREESRESWILTSNLPEAQTGKPERIGITGATSWVRKLKYIQAVDIRMEINTYWIPTMCRAPSPTVSLNITEVTFTQPASSEYGFSGHSWSSFHDSTHLSGHADFTAVFRHHLGN